MSPMLPSRLLRRLTLALAALLWLAPVPASEAEEEVAQIRLLDRAGRPIAGAAVRIRPTKTAQDADASAGRWHFTDDRGEVSALDVPLDGSFEATAFASDPESARRAWADAVVIDARKTEIRSSYGLRLQLAVVDAETGAPVPNAAWGTGWRKTDGKRIPTGTLLRARPGGRVSDEFNVTVPPGYVDWHSDFLYSPVPAGTRTLAVTYPLRRAVPVEVALRTSDIDDMPESIEVSFDVANSRTSWRAVAPDAKGVLRIPGVPFFRDEPLRIRIRRGELDGIELLTRIPATNPKVLRLEASLADFGYIEPDGSGIGIGGGAGGTFEKGPLRPLPSARQDLRVRLLDVAGKPLAGKRVKAQREERVGEVRPAFEEARREAVTDEAGWVRWADVLPGRWTLTAEAVRFEVRDTVSVPADRALETTIREPFGADVRVRVVDAEGRPVPFAKLEASDSLRRNEWEPTTQNGVQRADRYTNARGERLLKRVVPGPVTIRTWFGSRYGSVRIELEDRGSDEVVIRLPHAGETPGVDLLR